MDTNQATQVANFLNSQNQLVTHYTAEAVFQAREQYLLELAEDGSVLGCAEFKRVQWYQYEICHVSVMKEGQGTGRKLLERAERQGVENGGRIIQCTIRLDNERSKRLFGRNGFLQVSEFYYPQSRNMVGVWQKVISFSPAKSGTE